MSQIGPYVEKSNNCTTKSTTLGGKTFKEDHFSQYVNSDEHRNIASSPSCIDSIPISKPLTTESSPQDPSPILKIETCFRNLVLLNISPVSRKKTE